MPVDPLLLEPIADRAWPAAQRGRLGRWLLNASAGYSGRINACWPLGEPGLPLAQAVEVVEGWYAARGLPPLFKPVDGAGPALLAELERRGYRPRTPTLMMTGPLDAPPGRARVTDSPDGGFAEVFVAAQGDLADADERMGAFRRIPPPRFFARVDVDGEPAAIGGCAVEGEWAGLFGMRTAPAHRRKGLAREVVGALFEAARGAGATRGYLQVEAPNAPAIALYEGFGFETAYGYRYWAR